MWNVYKRAFHRQFDLARSLGIKIPELPVTVADLFDRRIHALSDVLSYFSNP